MAGEHGHLWQRLESLERQARELVLDVAKLREELSRLSRAAPTPQATAEKAKPTDQAQAARPAPGSRPQHEAALGASRRRLADVEFWLGGRGLLLLGVLALVFAVAFFVKEAIERGWIGPTARVLAGAGVGVIAVIAGERIRAAGYRTYGLWLAAGGFSAVYLSVWAAAAFYTLIPTGLAFALMVGVGAAAASLGLLHRLQSFVALAFFGGYLAPLLLRVEGASTVLSLGYLALLSAAGLLVAARAAWPYLAVLTVAGGSLLTLLGTGDPHLHGLYLAALLAAALWVARRWSWVSVSALAIVLAWASFWVGSSDWEISGLVFSAYAAALWLACLIASLGVSDWSGEGATSGPTWSNAQAEDVLGLAVSALPPWLFYLSALAGVRSSPHSDWVGRAGLILGLVVGAVYVVQAQFGPIGRGLAHRAWRAGIGYVFWLAAPRALWTGGPLVQAWLLEGILLTGAGAHFRRLAARAAGLAAIAAAALFYWDAVAARPLTDPAFYSIWALTGLAAALGLAAWPLIIRDEWAARWELNLRPILLLAAAIFFLGWGTEEIHRFYRLLGDESRWELARDLTISGFWMAYAAALLTAGFRLERAPVRWAGLGLALIVAGKVFLYDLSQLARLYRIGSFMLLAVVLLALSFRYQKLRQGDAERTV